MPIPRIFTVFEFKPEMPSGLVPYARHLVAGNSFEQAKETILARAILATGGCAYMTTDEAAEACRFEVLPNVHADADDTEALTNEQARRWVSMHESATFRDAERHEPTYARIW